MSTASALLLTLAFAANGDTVLLEFTSEWCGSCRVMEPTIDRLVSAGYPVRKIDVDRSRQTAARFRIDGVPCFVMLVDGREVDRVSGSVSHDRLIQMYEMARNPVPNPRASPTRSFARHNDVVRAQSPDRELAAVPHVGQSAVATAVTFGAHPSRLPAARSMPGSSSHRTHFTAVHSAFQATVRLRVEDPLGHGYGSGTIIDVHGTEALVVTCGHLFRESAGKGKIEVDIFQNGQPRTVPGQLISYDLKRDIAMVSISPGRPISSARVAASGQGLARGVAVFSVGCDKGQRPSVRESRITAIDRYLGPPNIEVAGQPVDGRSGGGLFSSDGRLIGICNAADPADNEGIYAGLPTIHWELDRINQRRIYQPAREPLPRQAGPAPASVVQPLAPHTAPPSMPNRMVVPTVAGQIQGHSVPLDSLGSDTEVICIIRSRHDPQGNQRLLVLDNPSADLLDRLRQASRAGVAAASLARHREAPRRTGFDPVIRAQSADR
jgi:thiol-disulfide isomerase/thioredoxin